jgi:hypothetical protein
VHPPQGARLDQPHRLARDSHLGGDLPQGPAFAVPEAVTQRDHAALLLPQDLEQRCDVASVLLPEKLRLGIGGVPMGQHVEPGEIVAVPDRLLERHVVQEQPLEEIDLRGRDTGLP